MPSWDVHVQIWGPITAPIPTGCTISERGIKEADPPSRSDKITAYSREPNNSAMALSFVLFINWHEPDLCRCGDAPEKVSREHRDNKCDFGQLCSQTQTVYITASQRRLAGDEITRGGYHAVPS